MTNFWGTKETLNWTVDNLIQGEKMDSFGDCKEADITELFKRCFDLADQLFDQTLVQREVLLDACERLKQWVEEVYKNTGITDNCELNSYYQLARGNVRFRQALILNRWKPLPYSMCQEAQTCFEEAQKAEESVCRWLAQLMAAKCEREMEKFRYHHSTSPSFQRGEGALKAFERIVREISPDSMKLGKITLDAVINMGRCLRNQMKHQEGIPYFAAVCAELAPRCGDGEGEKIVAQKKLLETYGRIDAGVEENLHTAVEKLQLKQQCDDKNSKKDPQYLQALVNLVACLTDGPREYAMAQELALHVLERIEDENTDMQNNLGRLYRKRGDYLKAKETHRVVMDHLRRARKENKNYFVDETASLNRYAELEQAKCSIRLKYFEQALEQLDRLLGFYDRDPELLLWKGLCYRNQGQLTQAVEVLKDLCEAETVIRPGTVGLKARYAMGTCYLARKATAQAKGWFEEIVQAEPSDIPALKNLGWCQQLLGEYQQAIQSYQEVQKNTEEGPYPRRDFTWTSTYNNLGQCCLHQGQVRKALEHFEKVVKEESSNFTALCGAASCLRRLGRTAGAVKWVQKARQAAPNDPHVESEYVLCLIRNGEKSRDEVINQILNVDQVFPRELCVQALAELARCVERIRDEQERKNKYQAFHYLRPMKWEAASQQVEALVNSAEFREIYREPGAGKQPEVDRERQGKLLAHVYCLHDTMEQIKTTLRLNREQLGEKPCWHYTRMGTMQKLLLAQGEQPPRFRLSNVAYMNDSAEGESFGKLLEQCGSAPEMLRAYGLLPGGAAPGDSSLRNVYLTSLCTADDYIYMWAIYADKGTGCSLKFDENFFDVKKSYPWSYIPFYEERDSYPLYRIVYLTDGEQLQNTETELRNHLVELARLLEKIHREFPEKQQQEPSEEKQQAKNKILRAYIAAMLDQVRYLFKYNEYASENEVRCLVVTRNRKLAPGAGDTPYLYTEIDKEIRLDEVRFGPKVSKSPEKEAWMYATGRVKKVSYSNRHYR